MGEHTIIFAFGNDHRVHHPIMATGKQLTMRRYNDDFVYRLPNHYDYHTIYLVGSGCGKAPANTGVLGRRTFYYLALVLWTIMVANHYYDSVGVKPSVRERVHEYGE